MYQNAFSNVHQSVRDSAENQGIQAWRPTRPAPVNSEIGISLSGDYPNDYRDRQLPPAGGRADGLPMGDFRR